MKKTLIAISVACVAALASMAEEDTAGSGAYESLKFATNTWFTVTNGTSGAVVEGGMIVGDLVQIGDDFLGFDTTESGVPVVFKAADDNERTNDITTVTFDVKAATVPNGKLAAVSAATNAVCLYESATDPAATNFCVKVSGAEWVQMGSTKVPFEGDAYKLVARFDNRAEAKKVQFAAIIAGEEVVLTNGNVTDGWLTYGSEVESRINVGLLGKGALKALRGDQLVIIAEVIVIPKGGGKIEVDEKDLEVFETQLSSGQSIGEYLSSNAQDTYKDKNTKIDPGLTVAQAYALGLVKSENGELVFPNEGELDVKAEAATVDAQTGDIKVSFVDVTPNVKSGAEFLYQLKKSKTGATDDWEDCGKPKTTLDEVAIPSTEVAADYHYFKVVTTVTLKDATAQKENQN